MDTIYEGTEILIVIYMLFCFLPGFIAVSKGRSFLGFFFLGCFFTPVIGIIAALCAARDPTYLGVRYRAPPRKLFTVIMFLILAFLIIGYIGQISNSTAPVTQDVKLAQDHPKMDSSQVEAKPDTQQKEIDKQNESEKQEQEQPTYIPPIDPTAPSKTVMWDKFNEYGIRLVATDIPCEDVALVTKGYQFKITSAIPLNRLKNPTDAFSVDATHATTVKGCWSPKMHKAYFHRKYDGKEWESDFSVNNTWRKIEILPDGLVIDNVKYKSVASAPKTTQAQQTNTGTAPNQQFKQVTMRAASATEKAMIIKVLGKEQVATGKNEIIVGYADFNSDQIDDLVVVMQSSGWCGSGGCSTYLIVSGNRPTAYETNQTFLEESGQFAVGSKISNGLKSIIMMNKGKVEFGTKKDTPLYGKPMEYTFSKMK